MAGGALDWIIDVIWRAAVRAVMEISAPAGAVGKETQRRRRVTPGFERRVASNGGGIPDPASWYGNGAAVWSVRSTENVQQNSGRHGHVVTPLPGMHGLCPAPFRGRSRISWTAQPGMP